MAERTTDNLFCDPTTLVGGKLEQGGAEKVPLIDRNMPHLAVLAHTVLRCRRRGNTPPLKYTFRAPCGKLGQILMLLYDELSR